MIPQPRVHIFGIRHHGPGSARSLKQALEALQPDCILVEGPPEANELLPLMLHAEMEPPVALLIYASDNPANASFYPFAEFSPEWQALTYGLKHKVTTRFFDLPLSHRLTEPPVAEAQPIDKETQPVPNQPEDTPDPLSPAPSPDPLTALAQAAGYDDFERWWNQLVEERQGGDVFEAILEAISALREENIIPLEPSEQLREATMRHNIRQALSQGQQNIAVICGAWHSPALKPEVLESQQQADAELLKNLPKAKVSATWVPWTFGRLARYSGYGAGITSPGWYSHLWNHQEQITIRWMSRVAALLREQDLEASSAQVIEAVRLADTLAALRGRPLPGLEEMNEAAYALFAHGNDRVLGLIGEKLIVGERLGRVPQETPAAPLQQDLARQAKRLRLPLDAAVRELELDLRKETDLERSHLLHRLNILGVPWGNLQSVRGKGTFKEGWQIKWEPEFAVRLIEAGRYGQTVEAAATGKIMDACAGTQGLASLPELTHLLDAVLLADLPKATQTLMSALEAQAAQATDIAHLMAALPPLAGILRYGNVRQTDTRMVGHLVDGLLARICVGLPNACSSLSDDAAAEMYDHLLGVHGAVGTLQNPQQTALWQDTLGRLSIQATLHGLIAGRCVRLLMESGLLDLLESARRLGLALSDPEPEKASAWVEGFLKGSGLVLIHDEVLFGVLDGWVAGLSAEAFVRVLPLLRRTFSTFEAPERRSIGEKARQGGRSVVVAQAESGVDEARGAKVLPLIEQLLGLGARP